MTDSTSSSIDKAKLADNFGHIRSEIDRGFSSIRQVAIVSLCFFLYVADGYDVVSIAMAAPHIAQEWGVEPQVLGVVLSVELIGMMIGSIVLSTASDKYGRRLILLGSLMVISVAMILTAYCSSIEQLMILRILTGIGIGGVMGPAAAIASEFSPEKRRNQVVIAVGTGFGAGTVTCGPVANYLLETASWHSIFLTGGIAGLVLLALTLLILPESLEFLVRQKAVTEDHAQRLLQKVNRTLSQLSLQPLKQWVNEASQTDENHTHSGAGFKGLLASRYRWQSLGLWLIFFCLFWVVYIMIKWMPKLFVDMGFTISEAIYVITVAGLGSLIGPMVLSAIVNRFELRKLVIASLLITAAAFLALGTLKPTSISVLMASLLAINFLNTCSMMGLYAIATNSYPTPMRASGLGYSIGIGRLGAVVSPVVVGFLVAAKWGVFSVFLLLVVPMLILGALLLSRLTTQH